MDFFNATSGLLGRWRTTALCGRLWFVVFLGLTVSGCQSPEERCLDTMRQAVYQDDFEKGLAAADRYYEKHAVEKRHPSEETMAARWEISAYTRLCLLMTDNLNRRFLAYYPVREMGSLFPFPFPMENWYCYARLYYEMGLYGPASLFTLWQAETVGWDKANIELLLNIYERTHQWRTLQTYLYALKNNPQTKKWTKNWERKWQDLAPLARQETWDGTWFLPLSDKYLIGPADDVAFLDGYVKGVFRHDTLNVNPYLTEYYTLLCLLEKNLSEVPTLLKVYTAQHRPLPDYLQEAALIVYSELNHFTHEIHYNEDALATLNISPAIKQRVENVLRDYEFLKTGAISFDDMLRRHAATYTYHLLLGETL